MRMETAEKESDPLFTETVNPRPEIENAWSPRRRPLLNAIGRLNLLLLCTSFVALAAATTFLGFLWRTSIDVIHGKPAAWVWLSLVDHGWLIRAVTVSSVVVRTGVAAQAGIITPMIASLLLERGGSRLSGVAMLSVMRCTNNSPQQLIRPVAHQGLGRKSWGYVILLGIVLATSIIAQFSSTILLLDFDTRRILSGRKSSDIAHGLHWDENVRVGKTDPLNGINYWLSPPSSYPRFAEFHEAPIVEEGIADTGITYRAYLPFQAISQREKLRNYTGIATVTDLRAVCVRPNLVLQESWIRMNTFELVGSVSLKERQYSVLSGDPLTRNFNCTIPLTLADEQKRDGYWRVAVCIVSNTEELEGGLHGGGNYTESYIMFNATGSNPDWRNSSRYDQWEHSSDGAWTTLRDLTTSASVSSTFCFAKPRSKNYQVNMWTNADATEPSLGWDLDTGRYITRDILGLYGALADVSVPEERGILRLGTYANWTEHESQTDTVDLPWWSIVQGFRYDNSIVSTTNRGVILSPFDPWLLEPAHPIHRAHIAVFQDVIRTTRNPAIALQTLFTILSQTGYYDFLPQFDVSSPAEYGSSRAVTVPYQWTGFGIVMVVLIVHTVVLFTIVFLFLFRTRFSLLGNAWQAIGQVVDLVDKDVLTTARFETDRRVEKVLKAGGRDRMAVKLD